MTYPAPVRGIIAAESQRLRRIEHEYALELTAHNSEVIKHSLQELTRGQLLQSKANVLAMSELAARSDETNEHLSQSNVYLASIEQSLNFLGHEMTSVRTGIADVNSNLEQIDESVRAGFMSIEKVLTKVAGHLAEHSERLAEIGELLRQPYETEVRELADTAEEWLRRGSQTIGDDRRENWDEALKVFEMIVQNPKGRLDHTVWFKIGYLRWQHLTDVDSAIAAFNTARRVSSPRPDLYYLKSLRHLAYMYSLQGKFDKAYEFIGQAVEYSRDHETLFDAARYAARTHRRSEAIERLNECIDLEPLTIDLMFSEPDFGSLRS